MSDLELLVQYRQGSQDAFAALVARHIDWVYSAALRRTHDPHRAEDVTQAVFIALASCKQLRKGTILSAWLFQVMRYASAKLLRSEARRRFHEREAAKASEMSANSGEAPWEQMSPFLEEAVEDLGGRDREAVLLRFYQRMSWAEVGQALGISEEGARKRVVRAVEKLRGAFARRGLVLGAGALVGALTAHTTQAAPVGLVHTIAAASLASGTTVAASAGVAKKALAAMGRKAILYKILLAGAACATAASTGGILLVLNTGGTGGARIAATSNAPTRPAVVAVTPTTEASTQPELRQTVQLAQWDVLLNDNGLNVIEQLQSTPVQTGSKVYDAIVFNAAALRGAVDQARKAGGVDAVAMWLNFAQVRGGPQIPDDLVPLNFNYPPGGENNVEVQGGGDGTGQMKVVGDDQVHLKLNYRKVRIQFIDRQTGTVGPESSGQSILYDGPLGAGESLAFIGSFTTPSQTPCHHLVVWEAFKTTQWQLFVPGPLLDNDVDWWCQNGPEGRLKVKNQAVLWAAAAKHEASQVLPAFEKKLEDGKIVAAIGMCRRDQWPYCWWDAQGQAVDEPWALMSTYSPQQPFWVALTLSGPEQAWTPNTPTGHPSDNRGGDLPGHGPHQILASFPVDQPSRFEVGIPVGPWQKVGQIRDGDSIVVDGRTYRLGGTFQARDNGFGVEFFGRNGSENLVTITAVLQDGTEVDPATYSLRQIATDRRSDPAPTFDRVPLSKVKSFHVWKRKRQWVTFSGFAAQPVKPPTADVSAAQLAAAVEAMQKRYSEGMTMWVWSTFHRLKRFEALAADPKTPMGAVRAMLEAGEKGDIAAVRHRLICNQDDPHNLVDLVARWIIASMSFQAEAVARFGQDAVIKNETLLSVNWCERSFAIPDWVSEPDGGLQERGDWEMAIVKRSDGEYYVDMSKFLTQLVSDRPDLLKTIHEVQQAAQSLKENPAMTLGQLDAAMTQPATRPTTQKSGN